MRVCVRVCAGIERELAEWTPEGRTHRKTVQELK